VNYAVTVVSPPGYIHSAAFREVAETVHHGLESLGHDSVLTTQTMLPGRRHIVLGSNLLPDYPLPLAEDAILYNLEQVDTDSDWIRPELLDLLGRYEVWDYSERNAKALRELGVGAARVVPIGYVPELTRITPVAQPDVDVLFFGSVNARRQRVIDSMRALGLRVEAVFGVYATDRDALIARSKLVLNVHFYEAKVLEMTRISYLLANRVAVLSEGSSSPAEDAALAGGVAFVPYVQLAPRAAELIADSEQRRRLADRGFELMSDRPEREYLRAALR